MFKKLLLGLGAIFAVMVITVLGLLVWAQFAGSAVQEGFFKSVRSGDSEKVLASFHPELRKMVDEPVLKSWIIAFNSSLGDFKELSKTDFNTSTKIDGGKTVKESEGTVHFERGDAHSELSFVDGQIFKFDITSDSLPNDWFKGPPDTEFYKKRSLVFLDTLLHGKIDESFAQMHEALQREISKETLSNGMNELVGDEGSSAEVIFVSENLNPEDNYSLEQIFLISTDKGPVSASLKYKFIGMQGHLLGFNLVPERIESEE